MRVRDLVKLAKRRGWTKNRNPAGSHQIFVKNGHHLVIPGSDNDWVSPGVVRQILRQIEEVG